MDHLPDDLVDFFLEQDGNEIQASEEEIDEQDWRFGNEDADAIAVLKRKQYSVNTAKKILYVLKLWNSWVIRGSEKSVPGPSKAASDIFCPTKVICDSVDEADEQKSPVAVKKKRRRKVHVTVTFSDSE